MRVFRIIDAEGTDFPFILVNDPEKMFLCNCYDQYGQIIGCYDAGCASIKNPDFRRNLINDFKEAFGLAIEIDYENFEEAEELEEQLENALERALTEIEQKWIEKYLADNTDHVKVVGVEFWDGSNWQTRFIETEESEYQGRHDWAEIDAETEAEILAEYEKADLFVRTGADATDTVKKFKFSRTLWASDPAIAYADYAE